MSIFRSAVFSSTRPSRQQVRALVSFVVAVVVVKAFVAIIQRHGFAPFAWYRIIAGAVALVWLAMR